MVLSNQLRLAHRFLKIQYSSRTLSSFAQALQDQMNLIHFQLADIERRCLKQGSDLFLWTLQNYSTETLLDCTYTLSLFHQELESLGIISKGQCLERLFDQISFYENKPNCDLTLELIHILYQNLLISEMINNSTFFVRLFLWIKNLSEWIDRLEFFTTTFYIQLSNLFGNDSTLAGEWNAGWSFRGVFYQEVKYARLLQRNRLFRTISVFRKTDVSVESMDFWQLSYTEQVENAS